KKAVEKGLHSQPWVKTSLSPGSKVVTDYLAASGLMGPLQELGFYLTGYGCQSCIGNSGPLNEPISKKINDNALVVASVLSGNRTSGARPPPAVRPNSLPSPPPVASSARAGRIDVDLPPEPLGTGRDGQPVYLKDVWPRQEEINHIIQTIISREMFTRQY